MRQVMSGLPKSVAEITEKPHSHVVDRVESISIAELHWADPELIVDALDHSHLRRGGPLARLFGGFTPDALPQQTSYESLDTPENRYAKALLEHCRILATRLKDTLHTQGRRTSAREAGAWATSIDDALQHAMWRDVGPVYQFPANSQVLLRKQGYKDLLRYDLSLRMSIELAWKESITLSDGLTGDVRPVNQIYEYWCFFTLREILLSLSIEVGGGNFVTISKDRLKVQLKKGARSECRFEYEGITGSKVSISLFYNLRFRRPRAPSEVWEGSYTAFFDPDFSIRLRRDAAPEATHWLHFDAKYRLERKKSAACFEDAPHEEQVADADYEKEISRVHKLEDLFKMHTYRDGILGSRGAYVLFPGDGIGGVAGTQNPNLFVRDPAAFGGGGSSRIPSVGAFDLAPGGSPEQRAAIASLLINALETIAQPLSYQEERVVLLRADQLDQSESTA